MSCFRICTEGICGKCRGACIPQNLQKEKVGYGWTILDALYEENENWYEAITMVYCLEKTKDVAESMGISIQALTGVLYRARKWVKIHYNSDDYTK